MKWLILILGILTNASASVLIKFAVQPPYKLPTFKQPIEALNNWPFWLGLGLYGIAFLLYTAALIRLPLNVAHPILTSGAIATVALCAFFIFKEPFTLTTISGILFIILGVVLISLRVN